MMTIEQTNTNASKQTVVKEEEEEEEEVEDKFYMKKAKRSFSRIIK